MPRPPNGFRELFCRIVVSTFAETGRNLYKFRDFCDYDGFLENVVPRCVDERHLAYAFLTNFLPTCTDYYAKTICMAAMLFLSKSQGHPEPEYVDLEAARALMQLPVKDSDQIANWLNSYYP
jgi:hypothetical protein